MGRDEWNKLMQLETNPKRNHNAANALLPVLDLT